MKPLRFLQVGDVGGRRLSGTKTTGAASALVALAYFVAELLGVDLPGTPDDYQMVATALVGLALVYSRRAMDRK